MLRLCRVLLVGPLLLSLAGAAGAPPTPAAALSIYEPARPGEPVRPIEVAVLVHWDPGVGAYAIAEAANPQRWRRSPDGKRMLLTLEYGTSQTYGQPIRQLRRDLPFLNYERGEGLARAAGIAILLVDLDRKSVTPVKLPFGLERLPADVAWWDDSSILLVGDVKGGMLRNWCLRTCGEGTRRFLTRVPLGGGAPQRIEIPLGTASELAAEADFSSAVTKADGVIALSLWISQVAGGGTSVLFFSEAGKELRFTRKLDFGHVLSGRLAAGSLRGSDWLYHLSTDRLIALPEAKRTPPDGWTQVPCGGSRCPPGPALHWFVTPRS
jgi:hypothetical protein